MSRISDFIARFVDEKLSAARVLIGVLLLTLVTNGSLLLAQYGPPSGFDAPIPAFDAASGPEQAGEPVPDGAPRAPLPRRRAVLPAGLTPRFPLSPPLQAQASPVNRSRTMAPLGRANHRR